LHYCFTSPTKEDRVPKLVSASLRIHRSQGGFLLPSVTAHNQPFVRVYRFPTVILEDNGKTPGISRFGLADLALPALLAINITHTLTVQPVNADVLLSGPLLGLNQPGGPVDADDETSGDLRVQSSGMSGFLHPQDPLDPGHDFVRTRVSRFVEIENPAFDVLGKGTLQFGKQTFMKRCENN
jgi:hypothetical protein